MASSTAGKPWDGMHWSDNGTQAFRDSLTDAELDEWHQWQVDAEQAESDADTEAQESEWENKDWDSIPDPEPTVTLVDGRGDPLGGELVGDQPAMVQVEVPFDSDADVSETIDITVHTDGDSETFRLRRVRNEGHTAIYRSEVFTLEGGGAGGGSFSIGDWFEWSTGDFDGFDLGADQVVTFSYKGVSTNVRAFEDSLTMGLTLYAEAFAANEQFLLDLDTKLAEIEEFLGDPPEGTEFPDDFDIEQARADTARLRADTEIRLGILERAQKELTNDRRIPLEQLRVAAQYGTMLGFGADGEQSLLTQWDLVEEYRLVSVASARAKDDVRDIVLRQLGQATIGAYRLLVTQTGVASAYTALTGTNEVGRSVSGFDRGMAVFDLALEAATTGASIRWNLATSPRRTSSRLELDNRPRNVGVKLDGDGNVIDLSTGRAVSDAEAAAHQAAGRGAQLGGGTSGTATPPSKLEDGTSIREGGAGRLVEPEQAGMLQAAALQARLVARKHGVNIEVRPTGLEAVELRAQGALPKMEAIKSKTARAIDREVGLPEKATLGAASCFEPVRPVRKPHHTDEQWTAIQDRYQERKAEWDGPIGQDLRDKVADHDSAWGLENGNITYEDRIITGDYDLFDITHRDGTQVSPELAAEVVADLEIGAFKAQHGAHMFWDPKITDPKYVAHPELFEPHRNIYEKIVKGHKAEVETKSGGVVAGEPVVRITPEGRMSTVYAGDATTPHLSTVDFTPAVSGGRGMPTEWVLVMTVTSLEAGVAAFEYDLEPMGVGTPLAVLADSPTAERVSSPPPAPDDATSHELIRPGFWTPRRSVGAAAAILALSGAAFVLANDDGATTDIASSPALTTDDDAFEEDDTSEEIVSSPTLASTTVSSTTAPPEQLVPSSTTSVGAVASPSPSVESTTTSTTSAAPEPATTAAAIETPTTSTTTTTTAPTTTAPTTSAVTKRVQSTITITHEASGPTTCVVVMEYTAEAATFSTDMQSTCTGAPVGRLGLFAMVRPAGGSAIPVIDEAAEGTQGFASSGQASFDTADGFDVFYHWEHLFGSTDQLPSATSSDPQVSCEVRNAPPDTGGTHAADCFYGPSPA